MLTICTILRYRGLNFQSDNPEQCKHKDVLITIQELEVSCSARERTALLHKAVQQLLFPRDRQRVERVRSAGEISLRSNGMVPGNLGPNRVIENEQNDSEKQWDNPCESSWAGDSWSKDCAQADKVQFELPTRDSASVAWFRQWCFHYGAPTKSDSVYVLCRVKRNLLQACSWESKWDCDPIIAISSRGKKYKKCLQCCCNHLWHAQKVQEAIKLAEDLMPDKWSRASRYRSKPQEDADVAFRTTRQGPNRIVLGQLHLEGPV